MSKPNGNVPGQKIEDIVPRHIRISVKDQHDNQLVFKVKGSTPLEKLAAAYAEQQGKTLDSLRFHFDGTRIQPNDTPDSLEMEDDDIIDVFQEQTGGQKFL